MRSPREPHRPGPQDPWAQPRIEPGVESDWIARARAGDRSAQDALLRAHYPRVHASAFRLVGNPEDAEDLAQECFVRAFKSLDHYRGSGPFAGWLRRILVHLAQDGFRLQSKRPGGLPLPSGLIAVSTRDPQAHLEDRELAALIHDALRALPPALRVSLLLRTREGLEYEELGRLTGVTPATARTRVMKARKALTRVLLPHLSQRGNQDARRTPDSEEVR